MSACTHSDRPVPSLHDRVSVRVGVAGRAVASAYRSVDDGEELVMACEGVDEDAAVARLVRRLQAYAPEFGDEERG